ncbi:hypothetical protein, partial [Bombiscardovia coagulans]
MVGVDRELDGVATTADAASTGASGVGVSQSGSSSASSSGGAVSGDWAASVQDWEWMSSIMSRVVRVMPPAGEGERAFSRVGVMRKIVFYGLVFLAAFAFGWLVLFDDLRPWARERILWGAIVGVLSGLVVWCFLWRFEDGKGRPGFWFVLLSLPVIIFFGVCFGSIARSDFGVWRWVMVTVGVLVVGALSWFRLVPLVVRNRLG